MELVERIYTTAHYTVKPLYECASRCEPKGCDDNNVGTICRAKNKKKETYIFRHQPRPSVVTLRIRQLVECLPFTVGIV